MAFAVLSPLLGPGSPASAAAVHDAEPCARIDVSIVPKEVRVGSTAEEQTDVENCSPMSERLTVVTVTTGPCSYQRVARITFTLEAGSGVSVNALFVAPRCQGLYQRVKAAFLSGTRTRLDADGARFRVVPRGILDPTASLPG
jgi:hypothetical protein